MSIAKRIMDLVGSTAGLLIGSPALVLIAIAIRWEDHGPVLFRQERVGWRGRTFRILKFRTMVNRAEQQGSQLTIGNDPRITRVGGFLRRYKLDELPQLFNVLTGEMSLVGPRPEVPRYVALYDDEQRRVLELRPGITDPASVLFLDESELLARAESPEKEYIEQVMPQKIRINLDYAARANSVTDVGVIWRTVTRAWLRR